MKDIVPRQVFERTIHLWWLIAATTFLGGLAGWAFSLFHPPVYESTAFYRVTVDKAEVVQRLGLDPQAALESAVFNAFTNPAADVFYLEEIKVDVISAAQTQGVPIEITDFTGRDFILNRAGSLWYVTVRHNDPQVSAILANLWLEIVDERLRSLLAHAFSAESLEAQRSAVLRCFSSLDFVEANECAGTEFIELMEFEIYLDDLNVRIDAERRASRGLDTVLQLALGSAAQVPTLPVLYGKSTLIFAGSVAGLLLGLLLIQVPLTRPQLFDRN